MNHTLLIQLAMAAPSILISLGAILFAVLRFRVHPLVSVLASAGFAFHLAAVGLSVGLQSWIVGQVAQGTAPSDVSNAAALVGFGQVGFNLVFLLLVAIAVFVGRKRAPNDLGN